MVRVDKHGNFVFDAGFNGQTQQVKAAGQKSVFLGDVSPKEEQYNQRVKAAELQAQKQRLYQEQVKLAAEKRRLQLEEHRKFLLEQARRRTESINEAARNRALKAAVLSGTMLDNSNQFVSNPLSGFGEVVERIDADKDALVDIMARGVSEVGEYGVKPWEMARDADEERIVSDLTSYTPGKQWVQTMVDYARNPNETVVSFPQETWPESSTEAAPQDEIKQKSEFVKYALYAVLGLIVLKNI